MVDDSEIDWATTEMPDLPNAGDSKRLISEKQIAIIKENNG